MTTPMFTQADIDMAVFLALCPQMDRPRLHIPVEERRRRNYDVVTEKKRRQFRPKRKPQPSTIPPARQLEIAIAALETRERNERKASA